VAGHVYVDETKRHGYLLVASVVMPTDHTSIRRALQDLVLPGQRRLHMKAERDPRRRAIAATIVASGVQATIYDASRGYKTERDARAACLEAVVADAAVEGHTLLIIEQDDTLVSWDNQKLIEYTRAARCRDSLRYEHRRAASEQLLAIPDAIAWCWANGGDWRRRIEAAVERVRVV
jgi:hypothetical protein